MKRKEKMKQSYEIVSYHKVGKVIEFTMEFASWSFLVVYGKHINGYFCAVPNWGWGCEMSGPESVMYNMAKLIEAGANESAVPAIVEAIREAWKKSV